MKEKEASRELRKKNKKKKTKRREEKKDIHTYNYINFLLMPKNKLFLAIST